MRKLSAFVLAAAAVFTVAGAPMTSHAAVIRVGGNNTNGYMTSCNGQTGNRNGLLNQMGFNTYNGQNCNSGFMRGFSCGNGSSCNNGASCASGQSCSNGFQCGNGQNCGNGFGQCRTGNQGCGLNNSGVRPGMPAIVMPQM